MNGLFGPSEIVGIGIGTEEIRSVTLAVTFRGVQIAGLSRVALSTDVDQSPQDRVRAGLLDLAASWSSSPEWVVSGVPGSRVITHLLALPGAKRDTLRGLVKYEMEPWLPYSADEAVTDWYRRNAGANSKTELLGFALRKKDMSEHLGVLDQASLEPRLVGCLSLGALLAYRASQPAQEDDAVRVLLDLGSDCAHMAVFDAAGPLMVRCLDVRFDAAAPDGVGAASAALTREMNLSSMQLKVRPSEILATGAGSLQPGVAAAIQQSANVPVRIWDPLDHFPHRLDDEAKRSGPAFASTLGLALSALNADTQRVDFRQEEFSFRRPLAQVRGKLIYLSALLALVLALAGANMWVRLQSRERTLDALNRDIRQVYLDTFPGSKHVVNELHQMKTAIEQTRQELVTMGFNRDRAIVLDLLLKISERIPPESGIRVTDLSVDSEGIRIAGEAGSFEAVDALKDRLLQLPGATDVKVEGAGLSSFEKVIEFHLKVNRKP